MWPSRRWLKCIDMNKKQIRPLARLHGYWLYKTFLRQTDHWNQEKRRRYIAFDYACLFRHWAQAGYTFRAPMAALRSYVPSSPADPLWKVNIWQKTLYMSAYHLSPSNCDQYLEQILRFRPRYLRGYPSSLNILAEFAAPKREELGFVQGLFTASETLLPGERDNIEHTFGKKLYDWYG